MLSMKRICKLFFIVFMMVGATNLPERCFAQTNLDPQPTDPGLDPCEFKDPQDPPCPIDGGVGVLLALGVGYGIKKYKSITKDKIMDLN